MLYYDVQNVVKKFNQKGAISNYKTTRLRGDGLRWEMEVNVLLTKEHVILTKGSNSLWCARDDGRLLPGKGNIKKP